jgi:hypothetical protein
VVVAATLLDTLPESSTSGVGEVYQRLKNILSHIKAEGGGAVGHPGSSRGMNGLLTDMIFCP